MKKHEEHMKKAHDHMEKAKHHHEMAKKSIKHMDIKEDKKLIKATVKKSALK